MKTHEQLRHLLNRENLSVIITSVGAVSILAWSQQLENDLLSAGRLKII